MVLVKGCIPKEEADKMLDEVRLAPIAESKVDREPGGHDLEFADLENEIPSVESDEIEM